MDYLVHIHCASSNACHYYYWYGHWYVIITGPSPYQYILDELIALFLLSDMYNSFSTGIQSFLSYLLRIGSENIRT